MSEQSTETITGPAPPHTRRFSAGGRRGQPTATAPDSYLIWVAEHMPATSELFREAWREMDLRAAQKATAAQPSACPVDPAPSDLPVFNPLADGGRCEICRVKEQRWCLSCSSRSGAHLPNRFVCDDCLDQSETAARAAGRFEKFRLHASTDGPWKPDPAPEAPHAV